MRCTAKALSTNERCHHAAPYTVARDGLRYRVCWQHKAVHALRPYRLVYTHHAGPVMTIPMQQLTLALPTAHTDGIAQVNVARALLAATYVNKGVFS